MQVLMAKYAESGAPGASVEPFKEYVDNLLRLQSIEPTVETREDLATWAVKHNVLLQQASEELGIVLDSHTLTQLVTYTRAQRDLASSNPDGTNPREQYTPNTERTRRRHSDGGA